MRRNNHTHRHFRKIKIILSFIALAVFLQAIEIKHFSFFAGKEEILFWSYIFVYATSLILIFYYFSKIENLSVSAVTEKCSHTQCSPSLQEAALACVESSEDIIQFFDLEGELIHANLASRRFFNFSILNGGQSENQNSLEVSSHVDDYVNGHVDDYVDDRVDGHVDDHIDRWGNSKPERKFNEVFKHHNELNSDLFLRIINKVRESSEIKLEAELNLRQTSLDDRGQGSTPFSHHAFLLTELTKPLVCVVSKNISELKNLQHRLVDSAKLASLGEMASGIAHEINNPLSIIKGKLIIILRNLEKLKIKDEKLILDLNKIDSTTERIVRIVKSLRNLARSSDDDDFVSIDLKSITTECLEMVSERFSSDGVEIISGIENGLTILCRPTEIGQIIVNLLCNAYDAVKMLPKPWIKILATSLGDEQILLRVIDSGAGISSEILDNIMLPFFSTKPAGQGTGLGLSICKSLVLNHGGTLEYQLFENHTSFKVTLKRHIVAL